MDALISINQARIRAHQYEQAALQMVGLKIRSGQQITRCGCSVLDPFMVMIRKHDEYLY